MILSTLTLLLATCGWEASLTRFDRAEIHMGTEFRIVLYAPTGESANAAFTQAFHRIAELDRRFSDYQSESELSQLGLSSPHAAPVPVSDDLFRILDLSEAYANASSGAFDISVGPLTKLWRRARRQAKLPPADQLRSALAAVGHEHIRLDKATRSVQLLKPNMRLDLGGIAQGFAADEALIALQRLGIHRALVNASGDIVAGEPPPSESGWLIGIAPLEPKSPPAHFVRIAHSAVSTSGDAFQFVEIDGVRYSHIMNPRTGIGLHDRLSVSVIAKTGTEADALATAACVLGPELGRALLDGRKEVAGLIVYMKENTTKVVRSSEFAKFETMPPKAEKP